MSARRLFIAFMASLLAAVLTTIVPVSLSPAAAQGADPFTCESEAVAAGFDISWVDYPGADKYVIQRTVAGAGPYWRGAVDSPSLAFTGDAAPAQGGTVSYEVWVKDAGGAVLITAPCAESSNQATCASTLTPAGYDISWTPFPDAAKYVVERTVDGAGPYVRQAVLAPSLELIEDPLPNQGGLSAYSIVVKDGSDVVLGTLTCSDTTPALTCAAAPTAAGFEVTWLDPAGASTQYRIYRTVDGAGPYWRGAVNAPDQSFSDTGAPSGAVSVAYEVKPVVGSVVGLPVLCVEAPEVANGDCDVLSTGDGFTVRWSVPVGTVDVVIQRSVDGSGFSWRGKIASWNTRFDDGPLPANATTVDYEVRLETNSGSQISCTYSGVDPSTAPAGSPFRPSNVKTAPTLPPPLPAPVAPSLRPEGTVPYDSNTCATLSSTLPVLQPGDWVAGTFNQVRKQPFGYVWLPDDYQINGKGYAEVVSQWIDVYVMNIAGYINFGQKKPSAQHPGAGRLNFDSLSRGTFSPYLYPGPYAVGAPGGQYVVVGFDQRWGTNGAPAVVDYQWIHSGLQPVDPANVAFQAPAPCTIFTMMEFNYDLGVEAGILFGEDWLDQLQIQGETLLALGMGFIPGYDCVDAINNGINGWNAAGCIADLLGFGITLDLLRTADNVAVTIRSGDDIYGLIDEIPAAQWADELEDGLDLLPASFAACAIGGLSFGATTPVLMADGTYKPIGDVLVGDKVATALPGTSTVFSADVLETIMHLDDLVDATVSNGGSVTTTPDHLFWNQTDAEWQEIQDFDSGDKLQSADGALVSLEQLATASYPGDAYTLDVDGPSTFFVNDGIHDLLVHNADCPDSTALGNSMTAAGRALPSNSVVVYDAAGNVVSNGTWQRHHVLPFSAPDRFPDLANLIDVLRGNQSRQDYMNSAFNGAWLPSQRYTDTAGNPLYSGQVHNGNHTYAATDSYTQSVINDLRTNAATAAGLDEGASLNDIANHLSGPGSGNIAATQSSIETTIGGIATNLETTTNYVALNRLAKN